MAVSSNGETTGHPDLQSEITEEEEGGEVNLHTRIRQLERTLVEKNAEIAALRRQIDLASAGPSGSTVPKTGHLSKEAFAQTLATTLNTALREEVAKHLEAARQTADQLEKVQAEFTQYKVQSQADLQQYQSSAEARFEALSAQLQTVRRTCSSQRPDTEVGVIPSAESSLSPSVGQPAVRVIKSEPGCEDSSTSSTTVKRCKKHKSPVSSLARFKASHPTPTTITITRTSVTPFAVYNACLMSLPSNQASPNWASSQHRPQLGAIQVAPASEPFTLPPPPYYPTTAPIPTPAYYQPAPAHGAHPQMEHMPFPFPNLQLTTWRPVMATTEAKGEETQQQQQQTQEKSP